MLNTSIAVTLECFGQRGHILRCKMLSSVHVLFSIVSWMFIILLSISKYWNKRRFPVDKLWECAIKQMSQLIQVNEYVVQNNKINE